MTALRKVYIRSVCTVDSRKGEPDTKPMLGIMEARRMTPLMKRCVYTAENALRDAGIESPQAIICGTGYGCLKNTEIFFRSLHGLDDKPMSPTSFMQSVHNTMASMLAIRFGSHGYNATYSHTAVSFESALLDALLQIGSGNFDNALVGAYEEMSPGFAQLFTRVGKDYSLEDGGFSETAAAFVLTASPEGALCSLDDVRLVRTGGGACFADELARMKEYAGKDCKVVDRARIEALYGNNLSASAYALADAAREGGNTIIANNCPFRSQSLVLCGK